MVVGNLTATYLYAFGRGALLVLQHDQYSKARLIRAYLALNLDNCCINLAEKGELNALVAADALGELKCILLRIDSQLVL